jgi:phosphohistidine phosphatase SixA
MRLLLMRHGVAEDAGPSTGFRDEPRALTTEGRERMTAAARGVLRLDLGIQEIISSPLVRCAQTAAIVGDALGLTPTQDDRLRPGCELHAVADLLLEHPGSERVLLCGHQPDMSGLVAELTGGMAEFRKGTLAVLEVDALRPRGGYLTALYPPRTLRSVGV